MASLWENLLGRARPAPPRRPDEKSEPRATAASPDRDTRAIEPGPARRYLAVVARERPDLLARVNRLFLADGNVDAILDRRHSERRHAASGVTPERRRAERRRAQVAETDLVAGPVAIAQSSSTAVPERFLRWIIAGQEVLDALDHAVGDVTSLERESASLRATIDKLQAENHRLVAENEALRAREALATLRLNELTEHIAQPLGEIVNRLRTS